LLVPVGDIEALTDAMRRLIEDPGLRRRLGRKAREDHARAYDIRGYVTKLVSLWRDVARNNTYATATDRAPALSIEPTSTARAR
jgi:glycosyltransferase involved in cell wall biosynthesis